MSIEYAFSKRTRFKQSEAKQYSVTHDTPNICNNIVRKCDALYQYRIDSDADQNQKSLEAESQQRTEIILSKLVLFPVRKGCKRDRSKAHHQ